MHMYSSQFFATTLQTMIAERSSSPAEFVTDHVDVIIGAITCLMKVTKKKSHLLAKAQIIKNAYILKGKVPTDKDITVLYDSCNEYIIHNEPILASNISNYLSKTLHTSLTLSAEEKFTFWGAIEIIFKYTSEVEIEYDLIALYVASYTPLPFPKKALNTLISFVNS